MTRDQMYNLSILVVPITPLRPLPALSANTDVPCGKDILSSRGKTNILICIYKLKLFVTNVKLEIAPYST